MEKVLLLSAFVTLLFFMVKMVDMKYVSKEWKPLKHVIRDSVAVLISSVVAIGIYFLTNGRMTDFFNVLTDNKTLKPSATEIFTGDPGF
jgi:hypothetical protein